MGKGPCPCPPEDRLMDTQALPILSEDRLMGTQALPILPPTGVWFELEIA